MGDAVAVEFSEDLTVETAAEIVAEDPAVKYAIPNYYVSILDESVAAPQSATSFKMDDYQTAQWYLDYVKAPAAWSAIASKGGNVEPAKVAVIDTGVSLTHPDLANVSIAKRALKFFVTTGRIPLLGMGAFARRRLR